MVVWIDVFEGIGIFILSVIGMYIITVIICMLFDNIIELIRK